MFNLGQGDVQDIGDDLPEEVGEKAGESAEEESDTTQVTIGKGKSTYITKFTWTWNSLSFCDFLTHLDMLVFV